MQNIENEEKSSTQAEVLNFHDENSGLHIDYAPAMPSFTSDSTASSELADFLSRPVRVAEFAWTVGGAVNNSYDIWDLYLNATVTRNKLENYSFLNGNLHIKVIINASPFYYGAMLGHYRPLPSWSEEPQNVDAGLVQKSQQPHFWVYPQTNQGGEMEVPFFYYQNWLDITKRADVQAMGKFYLSSVTTLRNANSVAGTDVDVAIFAWMTDVKLAGPTFKGAMQSGEEEEFPTLYGNIHQQGRDEYGDGPVGNAASAIVAASKSLQDIPIIKPFMRATEVVASAVGSVASYFGFTNVEVISDVMPFKDLPFHSFASTDIGQPVEKLTLDPKNELSIDPRIAGLGGDDELAITSLTSRESYLFTATWSATDTTNTLLAAVRVTPQQFRVAGTSIYGTPMSHVSNLFSYWRGSLKYRIRFICSQFHKGRARIIWDPSLAVPDGLVSFNTAYSEIVDISTDTDVIFTVNYLQNEAWKQMRPAAYGAAENYANHGTITLLDNFHNGQLGIQVLNQQTSPVASADVLVVVSVMAGDDFELAAPAELDSRNLTYYTQESGTEEFPVLYGNVTQQSGCIEYESPNEINITKTQPTPFSNRYMEFMGEKVTSIRQLLRRVSLSRVAALGVGTTANEEVMAFSYSSRYPLYNGKDPNGINSGAFTPDAPYNFVFNIPFNWIGGCFVASRGAVRWFVDVNSEEPISIRAYRSDDALGAASYQDTVSLTTITESAAARFQISNTHSGASGQSLINQRTQTGFSISAPFYSQYRFRSNTVSTRTEGQGDDNSTRDGVYYWYKLPLKTTDLDKHQASYYTSIGTDFTFLFFLQVPTVYNYALPAAGAS